MKSTIATPRTDREVYIATQRDVGFQVVNPGIARELELELSAADAALAELRDQLNEARQKVLLSLNARDEAQRNVETPRTNRDVDFQVVNLQIVELRAQLDAVSNAVQRQFDDAQLRINEEQQKVLLSYDARFELFNALLNARDEAERNVKECEALIYGTGAALFWNRRLQKIESAIKEWKEVYTVEEDAAS